MFINLLRFEIKDRLYRLSSLVYFLVYFSLSFMLAITFAGAFKGASVSFGLSNKLALNSPVVLNFLICLVGYLGLLITAPIFGQSINKDFESRFSQILFSTPIQKSTYFFVRFLGSLISTILILTSIGFGIWLATHMPFVDQTLISENKFLFYLMPYFTNVIPNTLIFGSIFIAVISISKKMPPVYIASISVFTGWLISQGLTSDLENKFIAAMIDPIGLESVSQVVRHWSIFEQSSQFIPLTGVFLYNRILWSFVGLVFLLIAYFIFNPFKLPQEKRKKHEAVASQDSYKTIGAGLAHSPRFPHSFKVLLGLTKSEIKQAVSNLYFLMILLCGILYIVSVSSQIGKIYGTETLPVTYQVLEVIGGTFGLFVLILTTFYSGELIWKDRDSHFYELVDSKPVSNLYLYLSKLFCLVVLQLLLSFVILICCVLIQASKGYFNFEWDVYFLQLFVFSLPSKVMTCVFALFIQSISRSKYIGHSIVILYYVLLLWLPSIGLDHSLYLIGQLPRTTYSDMNRFGTLSYAFWTLTFYWGLFHLALAILTVLVWQRGTYQTVTSLFAEFKRRLTSRCQAILSITLTSWVLVGGFIFYNTNLINTYESKTTKELNLVNYERAYKEFEKSPHPSVIAKKYQVDIFPESQQLKIRGQFKYKNRTDHEIKKILVNLDRNLDLKKLQWSRPSKITNENRQLETLIVELEAELKPQDEVLLDFETELNPKGFKNDEFSKKVVENGSFIYGSDIAPIIGYVPDKEMTDDKTRRKYNLPERPRAANVNDPVAINKIYVTNEGDWIEFDATVSTSADQIAFAPGYLIKEWTENNRHYFHYKMDRPILNFYAFLSARYEVTHDHWQDVELSVYHHPGHTRNIARMMNSAKKSLDYFTKNFSANQFQQFRILEFPRYARFAQALPNTIPYSESIGFIAKVKENDPESIDYPFYVTAHELAHQWWGHQVIGAKVQGATMLSESLAQYSSLMVQEKEYGPKQMKKFLKYELDKYLDGRAHEIKKELPLAYNENQLYIHYNKGSLVFYALKDYLGEDVVNQVLKDFIKDVAYKSAPFTRAIDLVERFRKVTPADKQYLIEDLFETITFYDNRTELITYKKEGEKFRVTIKGLSKKIRTDELGKEMEVPIHDLIDVGLFDDKGEILYLQKHQFKSGENQIEIVIDKKPSKGGIDPINKLIDKISDDNLIQASEVK